MKHKYDNCPLCREQTLFSEQELIEAAAITYGKPICVDFLADALKEPTLGEAVEVLVIDSAYWDGAPHL